MYNWSYKYKTHRICETGKPISCILILFQWKLYIIFCGMNFKKKYVIETYRGTH